MWPKENTTRKAWKFNWAKSYITQQPGENRNPIVPAPKLRVENRILANFDEARLVSCAERTEWNQMVALTKRVRRKVNSEWVKRRNRNLPFSANEKIAERKQKRERTSAVCCENTGKWLFCSFRKCVALLWVHSKNIETIYIYKKNTIVDYFCWITWSALYWRSCWVRKDKIIESPINLINERSSGTSNVTDRAGQRYITTNNSAGIAR